MFQNELDSAGWDVKENPDEEPQGAFAIYARDKGDQQLMAVGPDPETAFLNAFYLRQTKQKLLRCPNNDPFIGRRESTYHISKSLAAECGAMSLRESWSGKDRAWKAIDKIKKPDYDTWQRALKLSLANVQ